MKSGQKKHIWAPISTIAGIVLAALIMILVFARPFDSLTPIELGPSNYGVSEAIDISAEQYNTMLSEKQSFVLMVDNPGCITTAKMREMLSSFSDNLKFRYYRIYWQDTVNTNIREYIKYFPSILIVSSGKVAEALHADSDTDAKYYNNAEDLEKWLKTYVIFPKN
ncbi:hypothetical protein IJG79_02225 [Candidatus Saccharibacteria bacterium]|nr:hypothetical protein [Candidatus Saccharibacteria bacterium]